MELEIEAAKILAKNGNCVVIAIDENIPQNTRIIHTIVYTVLNEYFIANNCAESKCSGNAQANTHCYEQIDCC